jgi:hypothetical protein
LSHSFDERFDNIEARLNSLRDWLDACLSAMAKEMRRAEARDEWMKAQLRETNRLAREQLKLLEEMVAATRCAGVEDNAVTESGAADDVDAARASASLRGE